MAPAPVTYLKNIIIAGNSTTYQREVAHYLDLIRTTETGRTLFRHINLRPTTMTIVPFVPTKERPVNAEARPETPEDAMPDGHVGASMPVPLPILGTIQVPTFVGTGRGSAVTVFYHPANLRQYYANIKFSSPAAGPGAALYHEMLHGYRQQKGQVMQRFNIGMDPSDEFYAVLASNVYISERGFTTLRASWNTKLKPMSKLLADSEMFYDEFKDGIELWFAMDPAFCADMAKVEARFNPFKPAGISLKVINPPSVPMRLPS